MIILRLILLEYGLAPQSEPVGLHLNANGVLDALGPALAKAVTFLVPHLLEHGEPLVAGVELRAEALLPLLGLHLSPGGDQFNRNDFGLRFHCDSVK